MEVQENYNILNLLNDIKNSIIVEIKQNIKQEIDEKFNSFEKKFDNKLDAIDKKFEDKFNSLEKKVDNNSANIVKILNTISIMQKDIAYLRDDVETIYCLEKDSRNHLKLS